MSAVSVIVNIQMLLFSRRGRTIFAFSATYIVFIENKWYVPTVGIFLMSQISWIISFLKMLLWRLSHVLRRLFACLFSLWDLRNWKIPHCKLSEMLPFTSLFIRLFSVSLLIFIEYFINVSCECEYFGLV